MGLVGWETAFEGFYGGVEGKVSGLDEGADGGEEDVWEGEGVGVEDAGLGV